MPNPFKILRMLVAPAIALSALGATAKADVPASAASSAATPASGASARRLNAYSRMRYVAAFTQPEVYSDYLKSAKRRIEDCGNADFPKFDGRKLYGTLTMNIYVDTDGRVADTQIVHSSGNGMLDRKAAEIVRSAAPFGRFSDAMRKYSDQIVFTEQFRFTHSSDAARVPLVTCGTPRR